MSLNLPTPTATTSVPEALVGGVTTIVYCFALTLVSAPAVPPVTATSLVVKLTPTSSLKTKLNVTGPVAFAPDTSLKIASVGGTVSGGGAVVGALIADGGASAAPPPQAVIRNEVPRAQAAKARIFVSRFMVSS